MDKTRLTTSDLLALRDGEPHAVSLAAAAAEDPHVDAQLTRMRELRSELQSLPDVPFSAAAWQPVAAAIEAKPLRAGVTGRWLRYPLATAASVFLASLVGIYAVFSGLPPAESGSTMTATLSSAPQLQADGLQLAGLMNRSRQLEMLLRGQQPLARASDELSAPANVAAPATSVERRLMGRLADVDAQIALMFERGAEDTRLRERLWVQRVNLLESLVAVRGGQAGDLFEDGRSM